MNRRVAAAPARTISAQEAAGLVRSGMWLDYGTSLCQPDVFDKALGARVRELRNVKIRHCLTMRPRAVPFPNAGWMQSRRIKIDAAVRRMGSEVALADVHCPCSARNRQWVGEPGAARRRDLHGAAVRVRQ